MFGSCISSVSYIKPQLPLMMFNLLSVVYRPFPTSNHNSVMFNLGRKRVVYRPFPTSNHNCLLAICFLASVVYRPFPTSNHNNKL